MLKYFDGYVANGLKPIAIYKNTKRPVGEGWNKNWSLNKWRHLFTTNEYNMGIILGDIIDVEGDSPEACELLEEMIQGSSRPKFSSSKSVHNLFLNPDPNLTRTIIHGIEFRGHLHQSVVPPSFHSDGTKYQFLSDSLWPIPPMPERLKEFYFANKSNNKKLNLDKGSPPKKRVNLEFKRTICKICDNSFYIHKKRLILEVIAFREYKLPWMCHSCREINVKNSCRKIRKEIYQTESLLKQ